MLVGNRIPEEQLLYPDLRRGLVGYWRPSCGPTGSMLFDGSPYRNHGTLTNMDPPTDWVVDRYGHALDFDDSNDYVSIGNGGGINNQQSISVLFWVRWLGTSQDAGFSDYGHICARQWNGVANNILLCLSGANPNTAVIRYRPYRYDATPVDSVSSPGNNWVCVGVTSTSGSHRMYVNGIHEATAATTGSYFDNSGIPLSIGAWIGDGAGYSTSRIAEVAVWTRLLTGADMLLLGSGPGILDEPAEDAFSVVGASGKPYLYARKQSRIFGAGVL